MEAVTDLADEDLVDRAADVAFERLGQAGGDPRELGEPFRTVAVFTAAQGVIDNGGLRHLFENDWPAQPPYATFSAAYRTIGANAEADAIDAAASLFELEHPEREAERRDELLAGPVGARIEALDSEFGSDVWHLLAEYVRAHRAAFDDAKP